MMFVRVKNLEGEGIITVQTSLDLKKQNGTLAFTKCSRTVELIIRALDVQCLGYSYDPKIKKFEVKFISSEDNLKKGEA